jgi:hypothetical protein
MTGLAMLNKMIKIKVKEGEDFNHRNTLKYFED